MKPKLASLDEIRSAIEQGTIFPDPFFSSDECARILNARDESAEFEQSWREAAAFVQAVALTQEQLDDLKATIVKPVFLQVSEATGQHEIASYIADDFEVIARAIYGGVSHAFIEEMWRRYTAKEVPGPRGG